MVDQVIEFINLVDSVASNGVAFIPIGNVESGPGVQQVIQNLQIVLSTTDPTVHQLHVELWYDTASIEEWEAGAGFGLDLDLNGNMLLAYEKAAGVAVEAWDSVGDPVSASITYSIYAAGILTN